MGQISLARFNRINASMVWESSLHNKSHHWLSTKLYIYLKLFIPIIFKTIVFNFFKLWGPKIDNSMLSHFNFSGASKGQIPNRRTSLFLRKQQSMLVTILQLYIHRYDDESYILVIYGDYNMFNAESLKHTPQKEVSRTSKNTNSMYFSY